MKQVELALNLRIHVLGENVRVVCRTSELEIVVQGKLSDCNVMQRTGKRLQEQLAEQGYEITIEEVEAAFIRALSTARIMRISDG